VQRQGTANSFVPYNLMRRLQLSQSFFIILANNEDIVIVLVRELETNHRFSNSQSFFFLLATIIAHALIESYENTMTSHSSSSRIPPKGSTRCPPTPSVVHPWTVAAFHVHFPFFFILQYSFAMYTRCIHSYMNHSSSASAITKLFQHS